MDRKWKLLWIPGIAFLVFSVCIFAVLLFGPSCQYSKLEPMLIGVLSLVIGVALIVVALLKGRSS